MGGVANLSWFRNLSTLLRRFLRSQELTPVPEKNLLAFNIGKQSHADRQSRRNGLVICLAIGCFVAEGCFSSQPPQTSIAQIDSIDRAAKPPDCSMPILHSEPLGTDYRKIAIVEAWGNPGDETEVLDAVRRGACGTGADALVILSGQSQIDGRLETMDLPTTTMQDEEDNSKRIRSYKESLTPRIGQRGHPGYFIDAVAIIYGNGKGHPRASP
jgi:hypothetical protein